VADVRYVLSDSAVTDIDAAATVDVWTAQPKGSSFGWRDAERVPANPAAVAHVLEEKPASV
jgi:hypothetical protein